MLYEIINMSDPYTIEAHSLDVATVACLFLGRGQYAFEPIADTKTEGVPMFLFGGTEEWCQKQFGESLQSLIHRVSTTEASALAQCLESCLIGSAKDRVIYSDALELIDDPQKREQWRNKWLEDRRSSMNNIGARAFSMAAKLRSGEKNALRGNSAPQQVFGR